MFQSQPGTDPVSMLFSCLSGFDSFSACHGTRDCQCFRKCFSLYPARNLSPCLSLSLDRLCIFQARNLSPCLSLCLDSFHSLPGTEPVSVPLIASGFGSFSACHGPCLVSVTASFKVSIPAWHGICLSACHCLWIVYVFAWHGTCLRSLDGIRFWFLICISRNLSRICHCVCRCFGLCLPRNLCLSMCLDSFHSLPGTKTVSVPLTASGFGSLSACHGTCLVSVTASVNVSVYAWH
jgi:hypothetical protein